MEFNELLKIRRSVRSYAQADIREEDVKEMIKAATYAASWKNSESGRYYVALSKEAINEIYASLPGFNQKASENAAYIIATFKKGLSGTSQGTYVDELKDMWGSYDLGLQNSYLMLKASDLGYDTLVMGLRDEEKIRRYFEIPEDEIIMPVIALGKKAAEPKMPLRKKVGDVLIIK